MTDSHGQADRPFRRVVHGTPITPIRLLPALKGHSFCVSFAHPEQLDQCIDLVADDGILVLDNGAYSIWRAHQVAEKTGKPVKLPRRLRFDTQADYRDAFWGWANEASERCEVAVAVIPDVIAGNEADNLLELSWALREGLAEFPERTMGIWHTDESMEFLTTQLRLLNFVGVGSCEDHDVQKHRSLYLKQLKRVYAAKQVVNSMYQRSPWIHLMRGLGVFHELSWAESADSCNVAMNHPRLKAMGDQRAKRMADRIASPIQSAAWHLPVGGASPNFDMTGE